jgi:hypothetical protein
MALTSGVLETCTRAMETRGPSCIGRSARIFFVLVAHDPQGTMGCVVVSEPFWREAGSGAVGHAAALERSPVRGRVQSHDTCGGTGALHNREARSVATGHVAALKPTLARSEGQYQMAHGSAWLHAPLFS